VLAFGREQIKLCTGDVSLRGVFLRTDTPPKLRQLVRVEFPSLPPDGKMAEFACVAVHVVPLGGAGDDGEDAPGVGVQWFGAGGDHQARWEGFIRLVEGELPPLVEGQIFEPGPPTLPAAPPRAAEPIRREHPRRDARLRARVQTTHEFVEMWTVDLSRGGMFLATEEELELGSSCTVEVLHSRSGEAFELPAVVRWRSTDPKRLGMGVEFVGLNDSRRDAFLSFIDEILPYTVDDEILLIDEGDTRLA
jgi:uncharacterized protein (TIGR02266 family)